MTPLRRCAGSCSSPYAGVYVQPTADDRCPRCGGPLGDEYRPLAGDVETSPLMCPDRPAHFECDCGGKRA